MLDSVRIFEWFQSPHEMFTWMQKAEPVLYQYDPSEASVISSNVQAALKMLEDNGDQIIDQIMKAASEPLSEYRQVEWGGTFDELINGTTEFANSVRRDFRESRSGHEGENREQVFISQRETFDFIKFRETYGV